MDFAHLWNEAVINNPYWQFEILHEENPQLAELFWDELVKNILVEKKLTSIDNRKRCSGNPED